MNHKPIIDFIALRTHLFFQNLHNEPRGDVSKWGYDDWDAVIHSTGTQEQSQRFEGSNWVYDETIPGFRPSTEGIIFS